MSRPVASMTGSGSGAIDHDLGRVDVEVRSVNHRFLKTTLRTWGPFPSLDRLVEEAVRRHVERGHVTVHVRHHPTPDAGGAGLDDAAFRAAATRLAALAEASGLRPPTVGDVLRFPGVVAEGLGPEEEALVEACRTALDAALDAFTTARRREGAHLAEDLLVLLEAVEANVRTIEAAAAAAPAAARDRLVARLEELLGPGSPRLEPEVLAREVALLADRADVREELTRLRGHVAHAREVLGAGGALGRRLDFLVQEMHREANTIGSKATGLAVSHAVVALKADVERLREQVQNLE